VSAGVKLIEKKELLSSPSTLQPIIGSRQKEPGYITFLFKTIILQLTEDLESQLLKGDKEEKVKSVEDISKNSLFFSLVEGISSKRIPIDMEVLLLTIMELNRYYLEDLEKDDLRDSKVIKIIDAIEVCIKLLLKQGIWTTEDAKRFYVDLSLLLEMTYGFVESTPVDLLISKLHSDAYLSEDCQVFIDSVTKYQFGPIRKILKKENLSDEKTLRKVAQVGSNFFSKSLKTAYILMMKDLDKLPLIKDLTFLKDIKGLSYIRGMVAGLHAFRRNTRATKITYLKAFRIKILNCFPLKKDLSSTSKVIEKKIKISGQSYTISCALQFTKQKKTIKAITVTRDLPADPDKDTDDISDSEKSDQDVYFFVQETNSPLAVPDSSIPLGNLPLFKFELIPDSNSIFVQEASTDIRKEILAFIKEKECECIVHMGIKLKSETIPLDIFRQVGSMQSSRALLGAIKTYMTKLDPQKYDSAFKAQLESVFIIVYVLITNDFLAQLWQEKLFDPPVIPAPRFVPKISREIMNKLKKYTLEAIEETAKSEKEPPFQWLVGSIKASYYQNPRKIERTNSSEEIKKKTRRSLQLYEPTQLLKSALEDSTNKQAIMPLVDAIKKGILDTIGNCKKDKAIAILTECFRSFDDFPLESIQELLDSDSKDELKATKLFWSLFTLKSLGLENAAKESRQIKHIKAFLNLK